VTRPADHLDEDALVLYVNGEPGGRLSAAADHLEECAFCRARAREMETAFLEFCDYWQARKAGVTPVPELWADIEPQLRMRERLQTAKGWHRAESWLRGPRRHPWVIGIAVTAAAAQIWYMAERRHGDTPANRPVLALHAPGAAPAPEPVGLPAAPVGVTPATASPQPPALKQPQAVRELEVMAALHRIGADVGEPVEVSNSEAGFELKAISIAPERERQIREAFAGMPDVRLRFVRSERTAPDLHPVAPGNGDEDLRASRPELAESLGQAAAREALAGRAMELSAALLARLHALEDLEHRFPADVRAQFAPLESKVLDGIRADHLDHARQSAEELQAIAGALGKMPHDPPAAMAPAGSALENARQLDEAIGVVLGRAPTRRTQADAVAELYGRLALVRRQLESMR
jgi:hypothetical protein